MYNKYSVLMSLYYKESPEYFKMCFDSILAQTITASEIVIVKDGPLTDDLEHAIESYKNIDILKIVLLKNNVGLGNALSIGVEACSYDLIARMDTDDIAVSNRFELQLKAFSEMPEVDIVGGQIEEFSNNPDESNVKVKRIVPLTHLEIYNFAKKRSPFNHMTVMFKKKAVLDAGNYQNMLNFEDYYLWARMLKKGCLAINLDHVLVYARVGNGMYARRGGFNYLKRAVICQHALQKMGFINNFQFFINCLIRTVMSVIPSSVRKLVYNVFLRKKNSNKK